MIYLTKGCDFMALKTYMDQQKSLEMGNIYKSMEELVNKLDEIERQSKSK